MCLAWGERCPNSPGTDARRRHGIGSLTGYSWIVGETPYRTNARPFVLAPDLRLPAYPVMWPETRTGTICVWVEVLALVVQVVLGIWW